MTVRVVLDTNVLVSGLLGTAGPPRQAIDSWLRGDFVLVTSPYQIEELHIAYGDVQVVTPAAFIHLIS